MRISDWSSDVCSSDLRIGTARDEIAAQAGDDAERAAVVAALRNLQIAVVPRRELEPAFGDEVEESVGRHRRRVMDRADHLFILMRAGDREHTRAARPDRLGFLAHAAGDEYAAVPRDRPPGLFQVVFLRPFSEAHDL